MSKDAVSQDRLMTEAIQKEERFEFKEFRPFQQHKKPQGRPANPAKVDPSAHFKKVAADILAKGSTPQKETVPAVRKERFGYETSSNAVGYVQVINISGVWAPMLNVRFYCLGVDMG